MFRELMRSFVRAYGRQQGYQAARKTSWLAIPLLIIVVLFGLAEMGVVPGLSHMLPDVQHMMRALR